VVGIDGKQLGVMSLGDALNAARAGAVDLVEIAPNATPPVCRLVDFGKFRYEQAKRDKESKKHQHANKVKEIQLSPKIDAHDLEVKLGHAIDFLCEEMKVKIVLKFRGREMAHTEFGFQLISKFLGEITPYGHADADAKLVGRAINVMLSPLPRNKRAKNPREAEIEAERRERERVRQMEGGDDQNSKIINNHSTPQIDFSPPPSEETSEETGENQEEDGAAGASG
jgi:translation initiation factor IF-3